ncbi:amidohydrolase [Lysinibacillus sp. NPDC094177]|uniref:amidohydrolase n=1 Tax=Lysinibacillus sp. NPDC094177 TaxID=3390580 RepID=UPI003D02B7C3
MVIADKVISSEAVFTGLENEAKPAAIAIKGNKIIAVGSMEEIKPFIGLDTKEYHYGNQLIMPGFHDAHLHLMFGSLFSHASINLSDAHSEEEVASLVKQFSENVHADEWIIGYGWDHTNWAEKCLPTRFSLDKVVPNRPIILFHAEGHYSWVNSLALENARVTNETEDPPNGTIQKDENNEITGILLETAMNLVVDIALSFPDKRKEELFEEFLKKSAQLGITSVNDLFASSFDKLNSFDMYKAYDEAGKLTTRIHLYPELNDDIDRAISLREKYNSEKLQLAGLKQFIDGVVTGHTAYMLDPYLDNPITRGSTAFPVEAIKNWVTKADKEGFQIRFHTIGDGAVRLALDIFEAARMDNGVRDSRHALEHIEVIHPTDIKRFKELGVVPSVQPSHLALMPKESHTLRVGKEKDPYTYLCKTLYDAVEYIAFGTDYPITTLDPFKEIFHAITRLDFTGDYEWNSQEQITLAEALKAYTKGSAYSTFRETDLGTLEVGKLADIIVLDKNLFEVENKEILQTKVLLTIMDGEVVYLHSAENSHLYRW